MLSPQWRGVLRRVPDLAVEVDAGVAVLTLNRPEHLNAYTAEMGALLGRAYRDCDDDDDVRAIVLTGAGRAFCAGADFSGNTSPFDAPADDSAFSASPIDPAAFELRKPVIAAVNGHAIGIGLTKIDVIADGLGFAEGPVWLPDDRIALTSISHGCVYIVDVADGALERIDTGGGPNGLACSADGTLYVAQNGGAWGASGPAEPGVQVITGGRVDYLVEGLGAPNDLMFGPDGQLWITDTRAEFDISTPGSRAARATSMRPMSTRATPDRSSTTARCSSTDWGSLRTVPDCW